MLDTAILFNEICALHNMGKGHPEQPSRVIDPFVALRDSKLGEVVKFYRATACPVKFLEATHTKEHLKYLNENHPAAGFSDIGPDAVMNPHTLEAARLAAGAQINAVDLVARNQAQKVFCLVRPPGHHATKDDAMGFCFYNNIAVGTLYAADTLGLKVAILDVDAHRGNGTEDILANHPNVLICSMYQDNFYPYGNLETARNIIYSPLEAGASSDVFRQTLNQDWFPKVEAFQPDLIYVSLGFDAHKDDPLTDLALSDEDYTWFSKQACELANRLCNGRLITTLEGGYHIEVLKRCILEHVTALHSNQPKEPPPVLLSGKPEQPQPGVVGGRALSRITPDSFKSRP